MDVCKNRKKFNALATVNEVREYLWYKGKSLNYNSDKGNSIIFLDGKFKYF